MGPSTCRDDGDGSDTSSDGNRTTWGPITCRDDRDGSDTSSYGNWTTWDHLHVETMEMDRTRLHTGTGQHGTIYM